MPFAKDPLDVIMDRISPGPNCCWLYTGFIESNGYGRVYNYGKREGVHRLVYAEFVDDIPDDMTVDHLCKVKRCVNPQHLELVSRAENTRRAQRGIRQTECKRGHTYDYVGSNGKSVCKKCRALSKEGRI